MMMKIKVFISHSSQDKKFVRTLKDGLTENSIETWLDEDQIDFGDSLLNKLENGLTESTHLVIVLSPASVSSEWVQFELKKALSNSKTGLTNKIIPIKYRDCKIPDELEDLLHANLSDEVVLPDGDRVKFISNGYDTFFLKLVRAIRNSAKTISSTEKVEIVKSIKASEIEIVEHTKSLFRGNFKLIGYSTKESRDTYQRLISKQLKDESNSDNYRPFLLPPSAKSLVKIKLGEKIRIEDELFLDSFGHFAGYRNDDLAIAMDKRTRDELQIKANQFYQVQIDPETMIVKFVEKIEPSNPVE